ncbi:hypothetical protein VHEMI08809 [[Torrubiella] hemipterigena]|uniref:Uncharacterized protein n=1 Tax=[Torrubiella] hemipterigena TaxID=1531966 RepID=A0A0A1T800_9HYPO|nr:hypothetical protein VHEMI08809 [[Torrubiella] hemipterigena]
MCPPNSYCVIVEQYPDGKCPTNGQCIPKGGNSGNSGPPPKQGHCPPGTQCLAANKPKPCDPNTDGEGEAGSGNSTYSGATWVGIDDHGTGCGALLQAGTAGSVTRGEAPTYYAWYEFYPDPMFKSKLPVAAGDRVYVNVIATSKTAGRIYIENQSKGTNMTHSVSAPSGLKLCQGTVEWIHEEPSNGGTDKEEPFARFNQFTMTGSYAKNNMNKTFNATNSESSTIIVGNGRTLCSSFSDNEKVTFQYKGPA